METLPPIEQIAIPTTTEGIAIHLGYISKNLADLNKKMDAVQNNTVNRGEWNNHLVGDEDHEKRLRALEKTSGEFTTSLSNITTTLKVWATAIVAFWTVAEVAFRYFFH